MPEVLHTVEVRWFLPGPIPTQVKEWFTSLGPGLSWEIPRIDYYLHRAIRSGQSGHRGIKFREGRLEIKDKVRDLGEIELVSRVTGGMESWKKWGFYLSDGEKTAAEDLSGHGDWIAVVKERAMRRYNVDEKGRLGVVEPGQPIANCELELSSVRAAGETWWSVALEAPGDEVQAVFALTAVGRKALVSVVAPNLTLSNSKSYPDWLSSNLSSQE
jgi:hypothetical protein